MKSQLLKQALMAKYQTGGKVKPPVKKEEKVIGKGSWTEAHAVKKLEEGYVPNLDADGKPILKDGKPTYKKPAVKDPDIEITPRKTSTTTKRASGNKYVPSKPKVKITPGETQEDIVFLDEPVVPTPPTPDPWKQAFAYQGRIQQDFGTQYPDVVIDGKRVKIQNRTIPAKLSKDGTWDTHGGYANATQVFGYVDPKDPSKIVPIDINTSKAPLQDKDGKAYYTPDLLTPYVAPSIDKVVAGGAVRAVGAARDKDKYVQSGIEEAKRLGVASPTVTNYVESINSGLGSLGAGKDIKVKESTNPLQYKGVDPTVNPLPIPANMEELKVKFKKGGLVSKYSTGGPIANPFMKGVKLNNQQSGNAFNALGQVAGTGVDYLDRKDGYSSIAGQAGASALKGAGQGAAIGSAFGVPGMAIGAISGAAIGGLAGGIKGKKEKTERIGLAADEMRGSVNQQQYSDSKDTYKSDLFREEDQKKGLRGLFAKGGTIKGPGTGTSDSIETKAGKDGIPYGSFIVPAVNNKENGLARWIREEVLGDNPNKVAKFKKSGNADMAVSNGEHLFTPAEKKKITAYLGREILEKLAPEAEENEDKKCGGMVKKYNNGGSTKYGLGDAIGMGAATLQAGYGLSQLMKDKRPIDKLDPAYNQLTNEAIAASKYGYSPAQKALLEQQITQGRIGQQAQINQLAGGNAAVGLTNSRAAINKEMMNKLQLASEDERLRMEKVRDARVMAGSRATMSKQLFNENLNAFEQKQLAGSELLGAGLSNIVGAARYRQEKMAQDQINKLMFGSGNIV
jgi:hypothetical protein